MSILLLLLFNNIMNINQVPDLNIKYNYTPFLKSKGFTLLMKWVLMTKEHPELHDKIKSYVNENKQELDKQNEKGWTALMLACYNKQTMSTIETVKILIDAGCNLNLQNQLGETALMLIVTKSFDDDDKDCATILINAGCDLDIKDNSNNTVLIECCHRRHEHIVKMLLDAGCDIHLYRITVLRRACEEGTSNIVKMLLEHYYYQFPDVHPNLEFIFQLGCHHNALESLHEYIGNIAIRKYIKKLNYINTIKHIPMLFNEFRYKFGTIGQKIITYNLELKYSNAIDIYNKIKANNPAILDYLSIHNSSDIDKLSQYVNYINT